MLPSTSESSNENGFRLVEDHFRELSLLEVPEMINSDHRSSVQPTDNSGAVSQTERDLFRPSIAPLSITPTLCMDVPPATYPNQQPLFRQLLTALQDKNERLRDLEEELRRRRGREEFLSHILTENIKAANEIETQWSLLHLKENELIEEVRKLAEDRKRFHCKQDAFRNTVAAINEPCQAKNSGTERIDLSEDASDKLHTITAASLDNVVFGAARRQFNANPAHIDWSKVYSRPAFDVDIDDKRIKQLRQHDYYKGWLDSMSALDTLQAWSDGKASWDAINYLFDRTDLRSPINAGRNVGILFGWSAVCNKNNMSQHDVRLDDRMWGLHQLTPRSEHISGSGHDFWQGVQWGTDIAHELFNLKDKSGVWQVRRDQEQMEYLRKVCSQGRKD